MKRDRIHSSLLVILFFCFIHCHHARYSSDTCETCKPFAMKTNYDKNFVLPLKFYFWGLYPPKLEFNSSDLCKFSEIKEIHEYTSISDGIYENLTLGIYTPRTLAVNCF